MASNTLLPFDMFQQLKNNWCWAANATSTSLYYNPTSIWTQCKVASACLKRNDCCSGKAVACDVYGLLDLALTKTQNFRKLVYRPLTFSEIKTEIDQKLVIGVRTAWRGGGAHFLSIYGYDDTSGTEFIYLDDSIYGKNYMELSIFNTSYQNSGTWTHSFLTQSPFSNMIKFKPVDINLLEKARSLSPFSILEELGKLKFSHKMLPIHAMAHDIYFIDFNSLKGKGQPQIKKTGVRLLDNGSKGNTIIYEFENEDKEGTLQKIIHGNQYVKRYKNLLFKIEREYQKLIDNYELRIVQQPELKVEAFWLHNNKKQDKFIPLLNNEFLKARSIYSEEDFFEKLKIAATNFQQLDNELLGG